MRGKVKGGSSVEKLSKVSWRRLGRRKYLELLDEGYEPVHARGIAHNFVREGFILRSSDSDKRESQKAGSRPKKGMLTKANLPPLAKEVVPTEHDNGNPLNMLCDAVATANVDIRRDDDKR